jgi:hypothetical protein
MLEGNAVGVGGMAGVVSKDTLPSPHRDFLTDAGRAQIPDGYKVFLQQRRALVAQCLNEFLGI